MQQHHQEKLWKSLCRQYPILAEYEKLVLKASQSKKHSNKELHQNLYQAATDIMKDKELADKLKQTLPKVALKIQERVLHHQHEQTRAL